MYNRDLKTPLAPTYGTNENNGDKKKAYTKNSKGETFGTRTRSNTPAERQRKAKLAKARRDGDQAAMKKYNR